MRILQSKGRSFTALVTEQGELARGRELEVWPAAAGAASPSAALERRLVAGWRGRRPVALVTRPHTGPQIFQGIIY